MSQDNAAQMTPEEYLSSDPAEQKIGGTSGGMDSLGSYEDGGDLAGDGSIPNAPAQSGAKRGTGSAATDKLSNNGNSVDES